MAFHLDPNLNLPLEREHEAWTIRGIEDYAASVGLGIRVCAVTPKQESAWPADEALRFRGKFFGLQFKRPYRNSDFVRWDINAKSQQFKDICSSPEIFYALPTYTNRALRLSALHHCLFWRPCGFCCSNPGHIRCFSGSSLDQRDLYRCADVPVMRWGDFVEALYRCELIEPMDIGTSTNSAFQQLLKKFQVQGDVKPIPPEDAQDGETSLYLVALEVRV